MMVYVNRKKINKDWKNNKNLKWIVTLILVIISLFCYMKDKGYCQEYRIPNDQEFLFEKYHGRSRWEAKPGRNNGVSVNQVQKWQDEYDHHHFHAVRTYQDAYDRVWYLPNVSWRQLGRDAWVAACSSVGGSTINSRLVIAFATALSNYGLHCIDEWEYIEEKLNWSRYHFDECAKYAKLLNR